MNNRQSATVWAAALVPLWMGATAVLAQLPTGDSTESVSPTAMDGMLIAHWSFDGRDSLAPTAGLDALQATANRSIPRTDGVHGDAIDLTGQNRLQVTGMVPADGLRQITFSTWVRPSQLRGFCELFRQECPHRLLFSFQDSGTILSLGLNVGGYSECDARVDPAQVLDGQWHHCAATFDGKQMRVYLDGHLVGRRTRPGRLAVDPDALAFIGSSGGTGEFFQGALDELRIYRTALSQTQINSICRAGMQALANSAERLQQQVGVVYVRGATFATTLMAGRRRLRETDASLQRRLASALQMQLRADFPEAYDAYVKWVGAPPMELLCAQGDDGPRALASLLVGRLTEYKPLTDDQWARQTPDQLAHWTDVRPIEQQYARLVARGPAAATSAEWIDVILRAGPLVELRPSTHEAVAPYRVPATPVTRDLTAREAVDALRRDWLFQADGKPTRDRIRNEIEWTRQLAHRIAGSYPGKVDFSDALAKIGALEKQLDRVGETRTELYFGVRQLKRSIALANPVVDFNKVLLVDMPFPDGSEWPHETRHRLGYMAVPGGRLLVLDGLRPDGSLTPLMPQPPLHGTFWRPDLSFDGQKVVFCFKPHNEKAFHLYEIGVDGGGLVQLTDGRFDDLDPIYLPDGHIMFSTTRGHTYVRCMPPTNAFVLARCDADGDNIYLISRNNEPDYLPSVMHDGRVIYTRWEYTDKPLWRAQSLWTVHPDGTQVNTFWGNQSVWPDLLKDARSIPGSRRVMFTGSAHHNWFSGAVGIIDPERGHNFPAGLTKVTAELEWPESGNGPVDPIESPHYHRSGAYSAYYSPYPLSTHDFLVSANRAGKFVLYLMDVDGNRELVYEGINNIFHAQPVRLRHTPPVLADRVEWPTAAQRESPAGGFIYSANVYQGAPPELHGKARYLRVLNIDPKTYTYWYKRPYISTGPVVSAVQSDGVKRILGTVPVESDGSVHFAVPTGKALHFQLLDEHYRALQTMRSFTGVMPGERRGCQGCHAQHSTAPQPDISAAALAKPPQTITPPPWGDDTVGYTRYVQPVLDHYCGKCHQGDGEARKVLDLTLRPGFLVFNEPYVTLVGMPSWGQAYKEPDNPRPGFGIADTLMVEGYDQRDPAAYRTPPPMTKLSYKSRLIDLCSSGEHYDVRVDPVNLRRLIIWVDTMCPYRGRDEVCALPDPVFQGVDWLSVRPRIASAPTVIRPGPVDQQ